MSSISASWCRIGDTLTVADRTGKARLEITVTRVAFSTGDQASPPLRRFFMGVHVEAHALVDEQHLIMTALVDGRYYDELAIVSSAGFQPLLGVDELSLNQGQRVAGWLESDVPTRHGQLVLRDMTLQHKVAVLNSAPSRSRASLGSDPAASGAQRPANAPRRPVHRTPPRPGRP